MRFLFSALPFGPRLSGLFAPAALFRRRITATAATAAGRVIADRFSDRAHHADHRRPGPVVTPAAATTASWLTWTTQTMMTSDTTTIYYTLANTGSKAVFLDAARLRATVNGQPRP